MSDLFLFENEGVLELRERGPARSRGVSVDFSTIDRLTRNQPLARAFGRSVETIFDATAGLGNDSFLLASLGYDVTACERVPEIAALLEDGVRRALLDPSLARALGDRLRVVRGDSRTVLPKLAPPPDAVYLDPMYPPKKKSSAIPRKSVRWLRALAGDDLDAGELFEVACRIARKRVVLKRPHHVAAKEDRRAPDALFEGKLVRYEVYLVS